MSDLRRIVETYLDVESNARKKLVSTSTLADPDALALYRGTQVLFRAHLLRSDGVTAYAPPADALWLFGIDNAYTPDKVDLVVSANDQFNIAGDWADMTVAGGKISWRVDLTSATLKTALAAASAATMYAALWMCPVGGQYTLMAHWDVVVRNVAVDPTTATAVEGVSFPTMDLYNADLAQLRQPTGGLYRLRNAAGESVLQLWNPTISKWQTVTLTGAVGVEQLAVGIGED